MRYSVISPDRNEIWQFFLANKSVKNNTSPVPTKKSLSATMAQFSPEEIKEFQNNRDDIFITDTLLDFNMVWEFLGNRRVKITTSISPENIYEIPDIDE